MQAQAARLKTIGFVVILAGLGVLLLLDRPVSSLGALVIIAGFGVFIAGRLKQ